MTIDLNDELVQDFLIEAVETVEQLSEKLVELEQSSEDAELLNQIFRSFHNIKGGGGFLGFDELVRVCHTTEEIFDRLRTGKLAVDGQLMDAILEATDVITEMIMGIRQGVEPQAADPELLQRLTSYVSSQAIPTAPSADDQSPSVQQAPVQSGELAADATNAGAEMVGADVVTLQTPTGISASPKDAEYSLLEEAYAEPDTTTPAVSPSPVAVSPAATGASSAAPENEISDEEFEALLDQLPGLRGSQGSAPSTDSVEQDLSAALRNVAEKVEPEKVESRKVVPVNTDAELANPTPAATAAPVASQVNGQDKGKNQSGKKKTITSSDTADSTIRVDTKGLDDIMNMVGELVLARNRLSTLDADLGNEDLTQAVNNLSLVASDLQTLVMKTRMQPIKKVFGRFPRVVRDLARMLNKEVQLEMTGEETALDKTLVDALADPLVHLVRNSVDHGVEMPEQRIAAGKPKCGRVRLMAEQKGDHIQVGVADDGAGLDAGKLRQRAVDKGLISAEVATRMSQEECYDLIFLPGFTTMDVASNVSGRGVGMDVVKTRIGQFNGSVAIESELGTGTVFYIKVPLTLAIMPTLMVKVAGRVFAIPVLSILEILEYDESRTKRVDGQQVLVLQNKVVPIFSLRDWLTSDSLVPKVQRTHMVLVGLGSARYGLIVDELVGQEEVVIKPLGKLLHGTPGLVGATITGDGKIALILDVLGLINHYALHKQVD